jgi:hypothetical protein
MWGGGGGGPIFGAPTLPLFLIDEFSVLKFTTGTPTVVGVCKGGPDMHRSAVSSPRYSESHSVPNVDTHLKS